MESDPSFGLWYVSFLVSVTKNEWGHTDSSLGSLKWVGLRVVYRDEFMSKIYFYNRSISFIECRDDLISVNVSDRSSWCTTVSGR